MKRKLLNSFIILTSSTFITKVFSLLNRMILSRILPIDAMSLYILIVPSLSLCITLSQFSIPSAVFRLISNPKYKNYKIIISSVLLCLITSLIMIVFVFISAKTVSVHFLKQKDAYLPLLTLIPFIPLVAISGIIKNYYLGKEDVLHLSVANFIEEVSRIGFSYLIITSFDNLSHSMLVCVVVLSMCIGELISIIYLYFNLHRTISIHMFLIKDNFIFKDIMNISLPLTGSRLFHSFYNFLEPIILIFILTRLGINEKSIHYDYSIMSGYVIAMLMTPTFFNNVILRLLIPILNRDAAYNRKKNMQNHILISIMACLIISLPFTFIFYFYGDVCLKFLYNTSDGYAYLKYMAIPFTLFYLQTPLSAVLQVLNKNKIMFYMSILEILIEFVFLIILTPVYHVMSVAIVLNIGLLTTLILSAYFVYTFVYK